MSHEERRHEKNNKKNNPTKCVGKKKQGKA
jgi:hypothetical protein